IASAVVERVGRYEKRASPLLNEQRKGRFEIAVGRRICNDEPNIDTGSRRLHLFELSSSNWVGRIVENANSIKLRDHLAQEPNSLCPKIGSKKHTPRYVASWPVETGDVAERDRIATNRKHNWDCRSGRFRGADSGVTAGGCDYCDLVANQFSREPWQTIVLAIRITIYDVDILAPDIANFFQSIMEGCQHVRCSTGGTGLEEPDHRLLLRACRERPSDRTAE